MAAALVSHYEIPVYAIKGEDNETYFKHISAALDHKPHIVMDDGADLVSTIHKSRRNLIDNMLGGTEETTTGLSLIHISKGAILRRCADRGVAEGATVCQWQG